MTGSVLAQLPPPRPDDQEATLEDYLEILYRRRFLALAILLLTAASSVFFTLRTPPRYTSSTTVVVDRGDIGLSELLQARLSGPTSYIGTLAEILKSRAVATRAVVRAGLSEDLAETVWGNITVTTVEGTALITIAVTDRFPDRAARLANAVAEEFVTLSLQSRKRQAVAARSFLEDQVTASEREVGQVEERLLQFKSADGNIALPHVVGMKAGKLVDLETQRALASAEREVIEKKVRGIRQKLALVPQVSPSSYGRSPLVVPLREQLVNAEIELAGLREKFTEQHPLVVASRRRIEELRRRLEQALAQSLEATGYSRDPNHALLESELISGEVQLIVLAARERAVDTLIRRLSEDMSQLPPKELALTRVERALKIAEGTYLLLSQKYHEARIAEASVVPDIRVIDAAQASTDPVSPTTTRNILFGVALGLVMALVGALGVDYLDRSLRTPEEAERVTHLPVLAVIPAVATRGRKSDGDDFFSRNGVPIAAHGSRKSLFAEAFRGLRTSLSFASPDKPLKVIAVTSALPREGKTTIATNLAISFARLGRRVWLVEGDLRKPTLAHVFQSAEPQGLTDYLVDAIPLERAIRRAEEDQIEYIPVGSLPPNPAELIGSHKMQAFLGTARETADLVVCDTAPTIPVADSLLLAPEVDGVILIAEAGRTPREAILQSCRKLKASGAHLLGLVLTKVPISRRGYGYYAGYYSGYYYYGHGEAEASEAPERDAGPAT
jgi:tyrosine-protein kinase Etk/Wzc